MNDLGGYRPIKWVEKDDWGAPSHAELVNCEIRAFRRLCETPDFQSIRKDRGGNFHVTMRRGDKSQSFVSPTLWEAASRALEANGGEL